MSPQLTLVLYLVVPLWLLAGLADWFCHRISHIETTSGRTESSLHLLMLAEMGLPLLGALYFEINALILGGLLVALLAHEATAYIDLRYTVSRRHVSPIEQLIHSVLEMSPLMILLLLGSTNWGQMLALAGLGHEQPRFDVEWSAHAPGAVYSAWLFSALGALALIPYMEEWLRGRWQPPKRVAQAGRPDRN